MAIQKLWGGRFSRETDLRVNRFQSSISFDRRLYREDIEGSIAHVQMLGRCGILPPEEARVLVEGLKKVQNKLESGALQIDPQAEDIHTNVEMLLVAEVGEVGKKLHTARSRNDQVALDTRLYLRAEIERIARGVMEVQETLIRMAEANVDTIMPGYTHLQPAQPVRLAHHFLAYYQMLERDLGRLGDCRKRLNLSPLGAGALAGVTYPIDREYTAEQLGFAGVAGNSLDAVSDRDYVIEFVAAASLLMMHLSRFCEELILWSSGEFGFVEFDDGFSTGSSIMPQKKNPDVAELIRGKTGRVYGDLIALLTMMKGLPLAYNKDMQEDKESLFDAVDTVRNSLEIFAPMLATLKVNPERMAEATRRGFLNATDAADYLVKRGVPFREAHGIIGKVVLYSTGAGKTLNELTLEEWRRFSPAFDAGILEAVEIEQCVEAKISPGGVARREVTAALQKAREGLTRARLFW